MPPSPPSKPPSLPSTPRSPPSTPTPLSLRKVTLVAGGDLLKRLDEPIAVKESMHRDAIADASANVEIEEGGRMDCGLVHPLNGHSYVGDSCNV